jgi:hypothetical protein
MPAAVLALHHQRCANHPEREASARCPECGRFYCRECVTEHEDRVLCAACLGKIGLKDAAGATAWHQVFRVSLFLLSIAAVFVLWLLLGNLLLSIPSDFHKTGGW